MTKHLSRHRRQVEVNLASVILRVTNLLTFGSALIILIATLGYKAAVDIDKYYNDIRIHRPFNHQANIPRDPLIHARGPCPDYQTADYHK